MNGLDHWPEPIVRVQSLSESGMSAIPAKYIKPPSERPELNSNEMEQDITIPTIDLKGLEDGGVNCSSTISLISQACKEWGFFQVVNHGVSTDLIKRMMEVWRSFFHLPMEQKQIYANSPKVHEGYGTRLGYAKDAIYDWQDYYFLEIYPESTRNHDKWPSLPTSCKETVEEYSEEVMALSRKLMKAMSVGLGLEADCLLKAFGGDEAGASMRVNYYSKCPQPDLTLGISAHSDLGGMAVLLADYHVRGLQVRKGDKWVTVQPVPNAFIINIGDQIQVLTNGAYKSVEHRAMVNSQLERLSVAFFCNPEFDVPIRPIRELVSPDQPPLYRETTFLGYRQYVRSMGVGGKSHVDSLKVM